MTHTLAYFRHCQQQRKKFSTTDTRNARKMPDVTFSLSSLPKEVKEVVTLKLEPWGLSGLHKTTSLGLRLVLA
jgi:hypothetical protein